MGRNRRTFKLPLREAELDIQINDILPSLLIENLLSLPSSPDSPTNNQSNDSPIAKRRKTDTNIPSIAVCVDETHIKFSRACNYDTSVGNMYRRQDVGKYLHVSFHEGRLKLHYQSTYSDISVPTLIELRPEEFEVKRTNMFDWQKSKEDRSQPGSIWSIVDIFVYLHDGVATIDITIRTMWNETANQLFPLRTHKKRQESQKLIDTFFPSPTAPSQLRPIDFYEAAWTPPKDDNQGAEQISTLELASKLFPYQKRTLAWLLAREGAKYDNTSGEVAPLARIDALQQVDTFKPAKDAHGSTVFVSSVFNIISRDKSAFFSVDRDFMGGILAEEMGLGKTLEILGLITLHKFPSRNNPIEERKDANGLLRTGATLIVAPESLRQQWMTEISRHAPTLKVMQYRGCRKMEVTETEDIINELDEHDIVITTYSVLTQELHFAMDVPERSRRHDRVYRRSKSALVQILWWRVCLDEAQMIENGVSQAAAVARLLPRANAWGITGTPMKDDIKDLQGLLQFLRYEPYCQNNAAWTALTNDKEVFQQLFRSLALRHTKSMVREEVRLPPQKRYVISMPFSAVEEQHYQNLFKEMASECGVDIHGAPAFDDWAAEDYETKMATWLTRLRQSTLHPEIGVYNRRMLGYSRDKPMRTVDEVLNAMLEQSETSIRADERAYLSSKLTRGQLYENSPRVQEALTLWQSCKEETTKLVKDARHLLDREVGENPNELSNGLKDQSADELEALELDIALAEPRRKLRGALELHHRATFLHASALFQIRSNPELTGPDSTEFSNLKTLEDKGYDEAKLLRREILRESYGKANRHMLKIKDKASTQTFTEIGELIVKGDRGIETGRILDSLEVLYEELNQQANILDEWREHVIQLLLRPLVDEEDDVETTGEELADSVGLQDELMIYFQVLKTVIADRQDAINGGVNELVKHETEYSIRLAKNGGGPAPDKLLELLEQRSKIKPKLSKTSMRGAIGELRGLQLRLSRDLATTNRDAIENHMVSNLFEATQKLLSMQTKTAAALDSEVDQFKDAMNARLEFYRQLQIVSDSVVAYDGPRSDAVEERMKKTEDDFKTKLHSAEAKHRYLLNLKETGSKSNEPRMCIICQAEFSFGVLTVCGHQFCKECMMLWFKSHRNCPVCKRALKQDNLHDITIKPQQLQVVEESSNRDREPDRQPQLQRKLLVAEHTQNIYSEFNAKQLTDIKNIELDGPSYTTKVDTLVRHLLWLRESDPGAKSIIFSQYKDFLGVLQNAFERFRIGYASIDSPNGTYKFTNDPAMECFLLHARAHSSGLNLVNASHVFLCEPLLNTALELQAIARVDRIGQQHETTVWLYVVSGTVEESIYRLSARRRLEHMERSNFRRTDKPNDSYELPDASIEEANTLELENAALSKLMSRDRSAGELVAKGDLWECLFGNPDDQTDSSTTDTDSRLQQKAVMSYLAAEAADARSNEQR